MYLLIAGIVLMAVILGIFYMYNATGKSWLVRLGHNELVFRLAVVADVMIVLSAVLTANDLLE